MTNLDLSVPFNIILAENSNLYSSVYFQNFCPHLCPQSSPCCAMLVASDSLRPHGLQPTRLLCPLHSPGQNTGVGCHALLQGIFLTQGLSLCLLCLLHWQADFFFFFLTTSDTWEPETSSLSESLSLLCNLVPISYLAQVPISEHFQWLRSQRVSVFTTQKAVY